jgi:hypothetical protein
MQKSADKRALAESIALQEIRDRIEPVTRELLTDNVLKELNSLVNLLPAAIAELTYELSRDDDGKPIVEDPELRHKAAIQVMKFTVSNNSIAPANAEQQPAALTVVIGQAMESKLGAKTTSVQVGDEVVELRECQECHISKPVEEFVGQSSRCQDCHQKLIDAAAEKFGGDLVRSVHASSESGPAGLPSAQVRAGMDA